MVPYFALSARWINARDTANCIAWAPNEAPAGASSALPLVARQTASPFPQGASVGLRPREAGLRPLDQQIALELGHWGYYAHGHLARRAREGHAAEAQAPIITNQITAAWIAERSPQCDDQTQIVLRKRIGAALIAMRKQGNLKNVGGGDDGFNA